MSRTSIRLTFIALTSALLIGCGSDDKVDPSIIDADGDLIFADEDCDDENATVFPGAIEVCDGFDNNCDGQIDEGRTTTYFADLDGDGFGGEVETIEACSLPSGYTLDATDCDDNDASTHPDADELCDATDHDCDGNPDFGAVDATEWFFDGDGDGFGTITVSDVDCTAPSGYVDNDTDCHDGNGAIYPGQTEFCNGSDDNCDGLIDEDTAVDATSWFTDVDDDGHGDPATEFLACNAPSGAVSLGDDCDDGDALISPDAEEICDGGIDNDCDPATDEELVAAPEWFTDSDDDGYGVLPSLGQACTEPANAALTDDDCDDGDPTRSPGAQEICNDIDDDCDNDVDTNAIDGTTWYIDTDGDGFGDSNTVIVTCEAPPNTSTSPDDCDDTNPDIFPGADEQCNGGIDDDCDIFTFDDDAPDAPVWFVDADNDGYGTALQPTVNACDLPIGYADNDTDCNDASGIIHPNANELCDGGIDNDCDPLTDEADTAIWYFDGDGDGWGVDAPNVNGCSPPSGYAEQNGDCDDTEPTVNPGVYEDCIQEHCGTIAFDETWIAAYTHLITCPVEISGAAKPVVTILDGAEVRFVDDASMTVAQDDEGALWVDGAITGVLFTSDNPSPMPGDWNGVQIDANDLGSSLQGLEIAFAGGDQVGALSIYGASPQLVGLDIHDNTYDGIHVVGGFPSISQSTLHNNSGDGLDIDASGGLDRGAVGINSFANNTVTGNGERPVKLPASYADELDPSSSYAGNTTDEVVLTADTLLADATWNLLDVPYRVEGNVAVEGPIRPVLTLSDGLILSFDGGTEFATGLIEDGTLIVDGHTVGVTFTSSALSPTSGDWHGLEIGPNDQGSTLTGLTVEYGGGNGFGGIYANNSSPSLSGVTSRHHLHSGFYGANATPMIDGCTFSDNFEKGVYLDAGSSLGAPFANNTLSSNQEEPLWLEAASAHLLDSSTTFSGNGLDEIALIGGVANGTLHGNRTWNPMDVPYRADGDIWVQDPTSPTWTLADGVEIRFSAGTGVHVGDSDLGRLVVQGAAGVVFTSAALAPAPGDWTGLTLEGLDTGSTLTGLTVSYAGGLGKGGVHVENATLAIDGSTLQNNLVAGLTGIGATLHMSNSTASNNAGPGLTLDSTSALASDVGGPTFTNNVLTANLTAPIEVNAASVGELDTSSQFTGNGLDTIRLRGGTLVTDTTVPHLDTDYVLFGGDLEVAGPTGPTVTVDDEVVIAFDTALDFIVGRTDSGRLQVNGDTFGVRFTSAAAVPAPGDWGGLEIASLDLGSVLTGLTIEYAGANGKGGLYVNGAAPTMTGGELSNNVGAGFYGENSNASLSGVTIRDNTSNGVWLDGTSSLAGFSNNTITGNGGPAITVAAETSDTLDATSSFTGNGLDAVVLTADTIDQPVTLDLLDVPYHIAGDITVAGGPTAVLTIVDGTTLLFDTDAGLLIGTTGDAGRLDVQGTVTGVEFSSVQAAPAPGDWDGITLGSDDLGSSLVGLSIRYGGGNGDGNIAIDGSAPILDGVTSTHSTEHGVYVEGAGSAPTVTNTTLESNDRDGLFIADGAGLDESNTPGFVGNTLTANGENAISLPGRFVKELDTSSSFAGNVGRILLTADVIDRDTTMQALDEDFQLAGNLDVQDVASPVLTIEDGVTVWIEDGVEISTGVSTSGRIEVGGVVSGVTFTSANPNPGAGDWDGLQIGPNDTGTALTGLTLNYGGGNGQAGLYINSAPGNVLVEGASISDNDNGGIYVVSGLIELRNSTVSTNNGDGVHLDANSALFDGTDDTFDTNTITGNNGRPLAVNVTWVEEISPTSSFVGNAEDRIVLWNDTLTADTVMHMQDVPYLLTGGDWSVDGIGAPILTIEDGVTVEFDSACGLEIGDGEPGQLQVQGAVMGVLFTSAQPIPAPGDWDGVTIGSDDTGSVLVGLTLEYGGGNGFGGLYVNGASPTVVGGALQFNEGAGYYGSSADVDLSGTTIANNTGDGVTLDSASTITTFAGNTITGNSGQAVTAPAALGQGLDATTSFIGNGSDQIALTVDTVDTPVTWRDLGVPFVILGDVTVAGGPSATLTVEDGVVARFGTGVDLLVGVAAPGSIDVQGAVTGVQFTSARAIPARGDWQGLQIGANDLGSSLVGLSIDFAGANGNGNVYLLDSSPVLTNVSSRDSTTHGVKISGALARPAITGSSFDDNDQDGIHITSTGGLDESTTPGFTSNSSTGNGGTSILLPAGFVKELDPSSSFAGNGRDIEVTTDTLTVSSTWYALDADYRITGDITVQDPTGPVLTVEDGVTARFDAGTALIIGSGDAGQLVLQGSVDGILLTSSSPAPLAGDWDGIRLGVNDLGSDLAGFTLEYAGANTFGGLWVDSPAAPIRVEAGTLRDNANSGIYVRDAVIDVSNTTSSANTEHGIYLDTNARLAEGAVGVDTFQNNVLTNNGEHPLVVSAASVGELDTSSSFSGNTNDLVLVLGTTTPESQTVKALDVDYEVTFGDWIVAGVAGPILTVDDGVTVKFDTGRDLIIGDADLGGLMVNGTVTGVTFTSAQAIPAPGDWGGVHIGPNDLDSVLIGLTIAYGGANGYGGLWVEDASPTLIGGALINNEGAGYYGDGALVDMSGTTISGNSEQGVFLDSGSDIATFTGNTVTGNGENALTTTADNANALDGSSDFSGNTIDAIDLTGATLTGPVTWADLGVPYRVTGDVYVSGGPSAVLTVQDGVTALFETGTDLLVATLGLEGRIDVQGAVTGVLFGSAQTVPARGDWGGLQIGAQDSGSSLLGLEIAYAGANGNANLVLSDSSPTLEDVYSHDSTANGLYATGPGARPAIISSRFEDNDEHGISLTTTAGLDENAPPGFINNTLTNNGGNPIVLPARFLNELAASSSFSGNSGPIVLLADTLDIDVTWPLLDEDYQVDGNITVADFSIPVLTVEDGVVAQFDTSITLDVGVFSPGAIHVQGGLLGVSFGSSSNLPLPGDWDGLRMGSNDAGSTLTNLTVEHAGDNGFGGIYADGSDPVLSGCTLSDNLNDGFYGRAAIPEIRGTSSSFNTGDGIYLDASTQLVVGLDDTFSNNILSNNVGYPLVVSALSIDELAPSSTFVGNGNDRVRLWGATLTTDVTVNALDVPYEVFSSNLVISGAATPVMTVEDAVEMQFEAARGLVVATTAPGALIVSGGLTGVTFTGSASPPSPGDWNGIEIGSQDAGSTLTNLTLSYGGNNTYGGLYINGGAPAVSGAQLIRNLNDGIHVRAGVLDLVASSVTGSTADGVHVDAGSVVANFGTNTLATNVNYPLVLNAADVNAIDGASTYASNGSDEVYVRGGLLSTDALWSALDVPYQVALSDITVRGDTNPVWTLEDGVSIGFGPLLDVIVADTNLGRMVADGHTNGVLFTSSAAVPAPGDWGGVEIGVNDTGSTLLGLTIEYAGANGFGGLYADGSAPAITDSTFRNNAGAGYYGDGASAEIDGSTFFGNSGAGVYLDSDSDISAFADNTVQTNDGNAVTVPARYAGDVDVTNLFLNNGLNEIQVTADTIDADVTWANLGIPYHVLDNQDILVAGGPAAAWTLLDGVEVYLGTGCDIRVGTDGTEGRLTVAGGLSGVLLTSDKAIPNKGDWSGIELGANDGGSTLTELTVEYAGANGTGNIRIVDSSPTLDGVVSRSSTTNGGFVTGSQARPLIQNSSFLNNDEDGLLVDSGSGIDQSAPATFTGNVLSNNGSHSASIPANFVGQLDASSSFTGNPLPINILGDAVVDSQTWNAMDEPYRVTGDIDVAGPLDPVLTLSDGVVLAFDADTDMTVGVATEDGTLVVDGTGISGVLFTADSTTPTPGYWRGVEMGGASGGSVIDGLTVEYGGGNGNGNLWINDTGSHRVTVLNSTSRLSAKNGLSQSGGVLLAQQSTFSTNNDHGIEITGGRLDALAGPTFVSNTLANNTRSSIRLLADSVAQLDASSTFTGNGTDVEISGGDVTDTGTWQRLDVNYWVTGAIDVEGPTDPILTLAAGVTLAMDDGLDFDVGVSDDGGLVVSGAVTTVTFTSANPAPVAGSWHGIEFGPNQFGSHIDGLHVEYGGGNNFGNLYFNGLNIDGTVVEITRTTSQLSSRSGVYANNSTLWIHDSVLMDNGDEGVHLATGSRLDDFATPSFTNNVVSGNSSYPLWISPAALGQLHPSSTFIGNADDHIGVSAGAADRDATWLALDVPVLVTGDLDIQGASSPHVDIAAGSELRFTSGASLQVGRQGIGSLSVSGTPGSPVVFTSSAATPLPGDWDGITLELNCDAGLTQIQDAIVEYGGSNTRGNVEFDRCDGAISDSTLRDSSTYGIYRNASAPVLTNITYSNNTLGDLF